MGRRALRATAPELEIAPFLKQPEDLPQPWDPLQLFDRQASIEIEVGSGKGLFLVTAAQNQPDHNFLGIEVRGKYARFAAAKLARADADNARMIHGDALGLFDRYFPPQSISAVHVYFPDPWWKKRHRKRRVMNQAFLRNIEKVLTVGGVLHFWTDVEEYFRSTLELIRSTTKLDGPREVAEKEATHDLDYRTHFERRMRLNNLPVYRSQFIKTAGESSRGNPK